MNLLLWKRLDFWKLPDCHHGYIFVHRHDDMLALSRSLLELWWYYFTMYFTVFKTCISLSTRDPIPWISSFSVKHSQAPFSRSFPSHSISFLSRRKFPPICLLLLHATSHLTFWHQVFPSSKRNDKEIENNRKILERTGQRQSKDNGWYSVHIVVRSGQWQFSPLDTRAGLSSIIFSEVIVRTAIWHCFVSSYNTMSVGNSWVEK